MSGASISTHHDGLSSPVSLVNKRDSLILSPEAEAIYRERVLEQRHAINRMFFWLLPVQWVFAVFLSLVVSPLTWAGLSSSVHPHVWVAVLGGGLLVSAPLLCLYYRPDVNLTLHVVAVAQMLFSALLIHLTGGRIETHFHVFGSLAILAFYIDWRVLMTAGLVVLVDHLLRGLFLPRSVYGVPTADWWRSMEHTGWVLFEMFFLIQFVLGGVTRMFRLAAQSGATQRALKEGEDRLLKIIDTAYDAYVALDSDGKVVTWSSRAEQTLGWSSAEMVGKSFTGMLIPQYLRANCDQLLAKYSGHNVETVPAEQIELLAIRYDQGEIPIEMTLSAVRWGDSHLINVFLRDISERHENAVRREEINRRLVEASRQAGKAEVAVGVLHNVGNVLNSVNVSTGIISETVRASKVGILNEVVNLVKEQNGSLPQFLTSDPRGKMVPELLSRLTDEMRKEHEILISETNSLTSHVSHIRSTVALQQDYATVSGILEKVSAQSLLDDALKLEDSAMARHHIEIMRCFEEVPSVIVDRHKALQILVNLLRNAKQAMRHCLNHERKLTLGIAQGSHNTVCIYVRDSGAGIQPENMTRIFAHGFTTKDDGHGFGLHISALSANEMGGSLSAQSDGVGKGATFTLTLPQAPVDSQEHESPRSSSDASLQSFLLKN